jgi:hypothetical protein
MRLFGSSQGIHLAGELALQIGGLVLVDDAFFSQFVDHGSDFGQLFACFLLHLDLSQVPDRITGGLAIVAITIPALVGLPYIFFGCLVICHELDIFRTAKVRRCAGNTKKI